jgi:hypothetical protein
MLQQKNGKQTVNGLQINILSYTQHIDNFLKKRERKGCMEYLGSSVDIFQVM